MVSNMDTMQLSVSEAPIIHHEARWLLRRSMVESSMMSIQQLDAQDHVTDTGGQAVSRNSSKILYVMTSEKENDRVRCLIDVLKNIYKAVPFMPNRFNPHSTTSSQSNPNIITKHLATKSPITYQVQRQPYQITQSLSIAQSQNKSHSAKRTSFIPKINPNKNGKLPAYTPSRCISPKPQSSPSLPPSHSPFHHQSSKPVKTG